MYSRFFVKKCIHSSYTNPVSDFSDEQRETNIQLLLQVELGFPNGNGRHMYKSRLVKWLTLASSTRARELLGMEMVDGNGRHRYKLHLVKWLTLENEKKTAVSQEWRHKKEKPSFQSFSLMVSCQKM